MVLKHKEIDAKTAIEASTAYLYYPLGTKKKRKNLLMAKELVAVKPESSVKLTYHTKHLVLTLSLICRVSF